jgi:leucyl-tRNA synthetase
MSWPEYDDSALVKDTVEIVVQINGKVKEKIMVAADVDKSELEKIALDNSTIQGLLDGKSVVKVVAVPGRLINIVVK